MAASSAHRSDGPIAQPGPSRAFLTSLHPGGDGAGDVIVLALTPQQCRDGTERARLIDRALSSLPPGGIIWVDAPRRWRSAMMSALRQRGLEIGAVSVRRLRGLRQAEFALTARALRFGVNRGHLSARWRSVIAALQWMPFGRLLLTRLLPGVGFAAFRPGARPFAWLVDRLQGEREVDVALITNWRGGGAPYVVFALGADEAIIAKRGGADCQAQIAHEATMLKTLAPGLEESGLKVPRLIDSHTTATLSTLIESDVPGRPMATLIGEGGHRDLGALADRLAEWLALWNGRTLRHVELTPVLAEQLILSAARPVAGSIERGSAYLDWLSRETACLLGTSVPLVAAHNDLTMANVLGDAAGIRSVVDWEAASLDGLPLTDFRYAICDAAAVISGIDRLAAFRACFLEDGGPKRRLQQSEAPLRAIVGGPPEWLELCVHAGWLRHAANEQARSSSRFEGAFLAIAELLAASALGEAS
jgi:hypothetical protein